MPIHVYTDEGRIALPMVVYTEEELTAKCKEAYAKGVAESAEAKDKAEAEVKRLTTELGRAYRCVWGFFTSRRRKELLDDTAMAYHSLTAGAAGRYVNYESLDGSDYFIGKHVSVLHEALNK